MNLHSVADGQTDGQKVIPIRPPCITHSWANNETDLTSGLLSALASNEPMKTQITEIMTQAREKGAKMATNLTPNATTIVRTITITVPYRR